MVNWPIKPIKGYIAAHRDYVSKINSTYQSAHKCTSFTLIKKTLQVFANWLIGQLNQLMAISQTTEALGIKSMLDTKLNMKARVLRISTCYFTSSLIG